MEITLTPFLRGKVLIVQPRRGYRFSLDAVLLASYVEGEGFGLELGAGFGPVALMLKSRLEGVKILALDILADYLRLLKESLRINGFSGIYPVAGDVKTPPLRAKFDFVFSNPPYLKPERFRVSPRRDLAVSKWELKARVEDFLRAAFLLLKEKGRAFFVMGAGAGNFEKKAEECGFYPEERVEVFDEEDLKFLLFSLRKSRTEKRNFSFLMKKGGKYTPQMEEVLGGGSLRPYLI